jgi:platelet-activating factor acetylhydrolase IB subunit alpha
MIILLAPSDLYPRVRLLLARGAFPSARAETRASNYGMSTLAIVYDHYWVIRIGFGDVYPSTDGYFLLSTGDDMTAKLWDIRSSDAPSKVTMLGHEHMGECCAIAPPTTYKHLAALAGLKNSPPTSSFTEYMATGSRDRSIKIWDAYRSCVSTLIGHDNWVRALAFHPGGKYLLSVSDDKTLRCWDLSQDCRCVNVVTAVHERFITCLRWAPGLAKRVVKDDGEANASNMQIRCMIATGGADRKFRLFAH